MKPARLQITLGNKNQLTLSFKIVDTPIADMWVEQFRAAQHCEIDNPRRFYWFNSPEVEAENSLTIINNVIKRINQYEPLIPKPLDSIHNQDYLNYLHSIFETKHGLLHQQNAKLEETGVELRSALAELNIAVHRCEGTAKFNTPRIVCTKYKLSKEMYLPIDIMDRYGVLGTSFGTVYLNYSEIGKTLADLTRDNDNYISEDAFQPFSRLTADISVCFGDSRKEKMQDRLVDMKKYYDKNIDFFHKKGFTKFHHPQLMPLRFPVAKLIEEMPRSELLKAIADRQFVSGIALV